MSTKSFDRSHACLFGLETEYAVNGYSKKGDSIDSEEVSLALLEHAVTLLPHLRGLESRRLFLSNGGSFYVDIGGHPEFCTPECTDPKEVVRYAWAGDLLLITLAEDVCRYSRKIGQLRLYKHNVDYASKTTWGCHESYLHFVDPEKLPRYIIPHLVSRILYTGAGGFLLGTYPPKFTLSPRSWFFKSPVSDSTTNHRGIFNTRSEPLGGFGRRMHVILGESLHSHVATYLKIGSTALILLLVERELLSLESLDLLDPVVALHAFASDPFSKSKVPCSGGKFQTALEIQARYLDQVQRYAEADFMPRWAPELCRTWRNMLELLKEGPEAVAGCLDWATRYVFFSKLQSKTRNSIRPERLFSLDLKFSKLSEDGIFFHLDRRCLLNHRLKGVNHPEDALKTPPSDTRAKARGEMVKKLDECRYYCDWEYIAEAKGRRRYNLSDPFATSGEWRENRALPRELA